MENLAPLVIVIPLLAATFFACASKILPRMAADLLAICTSAVVTIFGGLLLHTSAKNTLVYWFGGWKPIGQAAIGIAFVVDPIAAGLVTFVGFLVTTAFVFAWRYFESVGALFHALMSIFLAAMAGFCLSGDLFTLFVFFELMSVAAFALTAPQGGKRVDRRGTELRHYKYSRCALHPVRNCSDLWSHRRA